MQTSTTAYGILLAAALSNFVSSAQATVVFEKTFASGANGVTQFVSGSGFTMVGSPAGGQLPITTHDNNTNAYTPSKSGAALGSTLSGTDSFSGLYNFSWSDLTTSTTQTYEAVGFLGPTTAQTRQISGALLRHYYLSPADATATSPSGYYVGLDVAFGSTGQALNFGYGQGSSIYLGASLGTPFQLAIGYNGTTQTLTTSLFDGTGQALGTTTASVPVILGGVADPGDAQAEISNLAVSYLGWSDYTGNATNAPTTWQVNKLSYYNNSTDAFTAATPEPASLGLLVAGTALALRRRRATATV